MGLYKPGPSGGGRKRGGLYSSGGTVGGTAGVGGGGKSVGGALGNLLDDAGEAVLGLGPGIYKAGQAVVHDTKAILTPAVPGHKHEKPDAVRKEIVEPIVQNYKETYGPLAHGDLKGFAENVYEHPLGPLLDLATVATLGAGGAAKVGLLSSKAGQITLHSPRALAREGKITDSAAVKAAQDLKVRGVKDQPDVLAGKRTSRNPLHRGRQELVDKLLKSLPPDTRIVGEFARYGRELSRLNRRDAMRLERKLIPYRQAYQKLGKEERAAFDVMIRYPLPRLLDAQIAKWRAGDEVAGAFADAVTNPKVRALYDTPTDKMLALREAADQAGKVMAQVLRIPEETLATRPFLHMRLASGAEFRPKAPEVEAPEPGVESLFGDDVGRVEANGRVVVGGLVRPDDRKNIGRVVAFDPTTGMAKVHFVNRSTGAQQTAVFRESELTPVAHEGTGAEVELVEGESIDALRAELEQSGRPFPIYDPDTAAIQPSPFSFERNAGGGKARPRKIGETKQSQGVLAQLGQLALGLDTLTPAYMRSLRFGLYTDLYEGMLAAAVRTPREGATLKKGYEWVRAPKGKSSSESVPYTTKTRADALDNLDDFAPDDDTHYRDGFTSKSLDDAVEQDGFYLQVPVTLAKSVAGEFTRTGPILHYLIEKPTKIWRALVLNLRPAWLVNNIVGNHLLLALKYFGPRLLDSYAKSIKEIGKADSEFRKLVEDYFPEQAGGTFIETQLPKAGKVGRVAKVAGAGLAPLDRATEGALRRTAIRQELKRSPQVKARLKQMRGEKNAFENAAKLELDSDPGLAREISDHVNDALGDFLGLSAFERTYVRAVQPFYAWYRAITLIALKLPLNNPGRTNILVKLGEIGAEDQDKKYPLNLQGLVTGATGADGRQRVFDTARSNPFTTVTGLGAAVGSSINPLIAGPARAALGESKYDQVSLGRFLSGAAKSAGGTFYDDLPQTRLLEALGVNVPGYDLPKGPTTLYDRSAREELLRFLGLAGGRINQGRARELNDGR